MSDLRPAKQLEEACRVMRWSAEPGRFALLGFAAPPTAADLALLGEEGPGQIVREGGETSVLLPARALDAALRSHPEARVERDLVWIRFEAPMDWELVGFLALITTRLATAGVPVGAVCGYSRDHLFVAERHLAATSEVLDSLFGRTGGRPRG